MKKGCEIMFSIITIDDQDKWDQIVKSFNNYDVYYLSNYTKAFQIHGDGEPILLFYEDENMRAINVGMKRDIAKDVSFSKNIEPNTLFDINTPYGYGGFIVEGENTEESLQKLDAEYMSFCLKENIISEFVRFHPVLHNSHSMSSIYNITKLGRTITMNLNSQKQIWNDLISKNRNVIRKARKSGVKIYWGRNPNLYRKFISLYNATMDKDKAEDYYYFQQNFYDSVLDDLKYNSLIFYATYEDKIISMSIILFANKQLHYHLSASDVEYQHLAPTNLLLYEVACWGVENGYKSFHLGGGLGSVEDSLFKFKKAFNKNSDTYFSIGRKIFNQEKYNQLIQLRKSEANFDENTSFFPVYRGRI